MVQWYVCMLHRYIRRSVIAGNEWSYCSTVTSQLGSGSGSGLARTRPSGLRASAEVETEPSGRNVSLGTTWALETAEITSLFNER